MRRYGTSRKYGFIDEGELKRICSSNPDVAECLSELKKDPRWSSIKHRLLDAYSSAHLSLPVSEAAFIVDEGGRVGRYTVRVTKNGAEISHSSAASARQ